MPQVADFLKLSPKSATPSPRQSRTPEPSQRFDDFLKNRSIVNKKSEPVESKKSVDQSGTEKNDEPELKDSKKSDSSKISKKEAAAKSKSSREAQESEEVATDEVETADAAKQKSTTDEKDESDSSSDESTQLIEFAGEKKTEKAAGHSESESDLSQLAAVLPVDQVKEQATQTAGEEKSAEAITSTGGESNTQLKKAGQAAAQQQIVQSESAEKPAAIELPEEASADETEDQDDFLKLLGKNQHAMNDVKLDQPQSELDPSSDLLQTFEAAQTPKTQSPQPQHAVVNAQQSLPPERNFAEKNVDNIVTNITGGIASHGGSMKIRLDPPNLGELQVDITVDRDGALSASFQTSNDEATRLLSHNLQNLKNSLEATGVSVDKIQVKQAAPSEQSSSQNSGEQDKQQQSAQDHPARQEQQRREILEKMWRKMVFGDEPLDIAA